MVAFIAKTNRYSLVFLSQGPTGVVFADLKIADLGSGFSGSVMHRLRRCDKKLYLELQKCHSLHSE